MVTYLTLFTAVSLFLLLMFQVFFLEDFYEAKKMSVIENAAEEIAEKIADGSTPDLEYWEIKEQLNTYIVDEQGTIVESCKSFGEMDGLILPDGLDTIYAQTLEQGEYVNRQQVMLSDLRHGDKNKPRPGGNHVVNDPKEKPPSDTAQLKEPSHSADSGDAVVYACMAGDRMVLITAMLTPVDATVDTLYVQFILAAVVITLCSVLLGWLLAGKIARPIDRINAAARGLSEGEYHSPQVTDYKEATELCRTLDYVSVELKKNEQLQRDLIANVSHDLRTPLTMITGYSEAIRDLPGENSAENIQVVIDEAQRLTELVNDVLDLSKLQSGTQSLEMERIDLAEILSSSVERCQTLVSAEGYHIILEGCEPAIIMGDAVRLFQIIYNLLGNALAYTGEDRTVRVTQTVFDGRVRVSVADSGKGIPEDELPFIWQRYYQSNRATNKRQPIGTGLGLSIVYNLVSLHQGECGVTSRVGEGSVFWFDIPLV